MELFKYPLAWVQRSTAAYTEVFRQLCALSAVGRGKHMLKIKHMLQCLLEQACFLSLEPQLVRQYVVQT